jgi:general secretion pathway protein I
MAAAAFRRHRIRGFTLLEVLVAVAILGLGLTTILSAQFSAVTGTAHARHMSVAVGLARCKMSELEDHLQRDGFPEISEEGSGPCCEGDDSPTVSCSWLVERPTFPEPNYGELDLDADLESSPLGALAQTAQDGAPTAGDIGDIASTLGGSEGIGELTAGGIGGVASMVMSLVYPELKAAFEASTRRVTVVLTWTEGSRSYDMEVVQWITQPQPGTVIEDSDENALSGATGTTSSGGSQSSSGSPTPTATTRRVRP